MIKRPIDQLDLQGRVIQTHESFAEAEHITSIDRANIYYALCSYGVAGGFRWRYSETPPVYTRPQYHPEEERRLLKKIELHKSAIYKSLSQFSFCTNGGSAWDDLYCEAVLKIWEYYPKVKTKSKGSVDESDEFCGWIYTVTQRVALKYYRDHLKRSSDSLDDYQWDMVPTIEENIDPRLDGLRKAIEDLDEYDRQIVILYLEHEDQRTVAQLLKQSPSMIRCRMNRIRNHIRNNHQKFFPNYKKPAPNPNRQKTKGKTGILSPLSKTVYQLDLNGVLIKKWETTTEAVERGFCRSKIGAVANGKRKQHRGFIWKYSMSDHESSN